MTLCNLPPGRRRLEELVRLDRIQGLCFHQIVPRRKREKEIASSWSSVASDDGPQCPRRRRGGKMMGSSSEPAGEEGKQSEEEE